ncbi:hypothetical protein V4890_23355 [Ralstonia solanacearum species complex bacterium KE056]|uniref:hypothetical protein n=1 Tax=Ralstonia solanacearum species complex bacterium KE056 TaxID=3119585 RepID=UPI002FC2B8AA
MNDYWLYLSKSGMTVGKTGSRQREATVLDSATFQADDLAEFVGQRVPTGKHLSVWLSGGHCHYVSFPRPRWVFAAGKLRAIAATVFEQKTMQSAAEYTLSLKPSRTSLHVCAIRHADVTRILTALSDRYRVQAVKPLAPEVLRACKRTARAATFVLYEPDSLTIARPGKEAGLLVATTGGASHASVLTRMLAVHADAPSAIEVVSMASIQTGLTDAKMPSPLLNGWLKRLEHAQNHGG